MPEHEVAHALMAPMIFLSLHQHSLGACAGPHSPRLDPVRRHDYTPTAGRQSVGRGSGQLVRGRDRFGHFGHEPVPSPDFEANVLARRRILTDYPENILMGPLEPGARPDFPDRRLVGS